MKYYRNTRKVSKKYTIGGNFILLITAYGMPVIHTIPILQWGGGSVVYMQLWVIIN